MPATLPPRRIAALAFIALTVAALALVSARSAPDRVSVPDGARAGQITFEPCTYDTDGGALPADCGTLVVPENHDDASSRLIALPVTRIRSRSERPREPIFRMEGGPGMSNMTFPTADRLVDEHEVVLVGYRGVDGSVRLDCPEVATAMKKPRDLLGAAAKREIAAGYRSCAERLAEQGVDLAGYSIPQRVEDFEAARKAMGYARIDLVSESAGTRTAQAYASEYPASIHRSVMIAVNPPGHFLWDGQDSDAQIRRYARLCSRQPDCAKRTPDLAGEMRRVARDIPKRWGFLPIHSGNARIAAFFGLMENGDKAAPLNAASTFDAFLSAGEGDASGLWAQSFMANLTFPDIQVWGDVAAIARADASAARRAFAAGDPGTILGNAATSFLFGDGALIDAWPANPDDDAYAVLRPVDTETLLVTGEFDGATPASNQEELLPGLRNGTSVVLDGFGHTVDFWDMQPAASTRLITTFLDTGAADRSGYRPRAVSLTPEKPMGGVARMVFGVLLLLPLLVAVVLAGITWRVRRRGSLSVWASAIVRSAFAVLAALAGWMAMVIVVLTASIAVPLDEPALVLAVMALPAAAATYAGWSDRRRAPRTRRTGMAAAIAGAVIGGWAGFGAGGDFLAVLTTAVGAVAAANLALAARDIWAPDAATPPAGPGAAPRRHTVPAPEEEVVLV